MEQLPVRRLKWLLLASSLACLVLLAMAAFEENFTADWRVHQADYARLLNEKAVADGKPGVTYVSDVHQIYLEGLGRVDRCISCHVGIDDPSFADAPQPLTEHPGGLLERHPADKFGCTICHQGQGRATHQLDAHGQVAHWPEPLLAGDMVYTSCGRCHYENDLYGGQADLYGQVQPIDYISRGELTGGLPGADNVARGKQLVADNGCLGCHKYRGRGGALGPEITHVGDKTVHDFDFKHVHGERTVANWMFTHFKSPAAVVPNTLMPEMDLSDGEAEDLAAYMISLKRKKAPAAYTPLPRESDPEPVRGEVLYKMYCAACHGADGVGAIVRDPAVAHLIDRPRELITPSLRNSDTLAVASDDYLRAIIAQGRPGTSMPAWGRDGGLSEDEVDLLVGFIRGWEPREADVAMISPSRGNARYGGALFRANCAGCHGAEGQGGDIGVSLRSSAFLAIVSDEMLAKTILRGRANTAMPAWRQFDNREVSDLLAFIRDWQPLRSEREEVLAAAMWPDAEPPADSVTVGYKLYRSRCAVCHGTRGEGRIGPSLNGRSMLPIVSNEFLHDTIVRGRPGTAMPAWRQLGSQDVADLVALLRSWQTAPTRTLDDVHVSGDWQHGAALYEGMCSSCHGPNVEGAIGPQLANPVFLETTSDAQLIEWISHGRSGTQMRPFLRGQQGAVDLTRTQIEDIVTFIRYQTGRRTTDGQRIGLGFAPRGEVSFARMCASCHGSEGEGATGPGIRNPAFLDVATDGFLRATIVLGRDGTEMRPMGHGASGLAELDADQINDLIAYLRLPQQQPLMPHRFVIGGQTEHGGQLYGQFCGGCHGTDGIGGFAPELNNAGFLRAATDGFLQSTIIRGRRGTAMRSFARGGQGLAELDQSQINNIVAYMRQWSPDTRPLQRTEPFPTLEAIPGLVQSARSSATPTSESPSATPSRAVSASGAGGN